MGTTVYFEETILDQGNKVKSVDLEFGSSSFYSGVPIGEKTGEHSIYIKIDGNPLVMDINTAKKFVRAARDVGMYFGLLDE